ncbi:RNA polymerase sigma factor [Clostridium estertheticum]|uniref:RNA polymerase sigma factor n=1 Tax=Clostridium estertheticum TaxID=238834 RepID=UPI001CF4727E|nr:RNA polymerase sigma factor [Clostridium estertheticum]MCB2306249.1 RNA polymerase sigma factor [Clostridium estertheticum]MCB2344422.1 RNA polymerase sigma factor [Clostridium estertheticum]MCB2349341.1 RNA polymerase sigma factor [Clostridium estertheticum]WAG45085.1 RNA polymerase sigma factor [Clostridium estertheticum]
MIDDNTIMDLIKSGDKKIFEELVIRHRLKALRFAQKYVKDEFIAEDIIQDSFALIYVKRMSYSNKCSFKTFLYTVIRNKCIDYLRKQKTVNIDDIKLRTPSAEDIVMKNEDRLFVMELLGKLNKEYKTALYLLEYENMSYKDISKIMTKSVSQVKIIIFRARKKLQKLAREDYRC